MTSIKKNHVVNCINYANENAYGMPDNAQRFSQGR